MGRVKLYFKDDGTGETLFRQLYHPVRVEGLEEVEPPVSVRDRPRERDDLRRAAAIVNALLRVLADGEHGTQELEGSRSDNDLFVFHILNLP